MKDKLKFFLSFLFGVLLVLILLFSTGKVEITEDFDAKIKIIGIGFGNQKLEGSVVSDINRLKKELEFLNLDAQENVITSRKKLIEVNELLEKSKKAKKEAEEKLEEYKEATLRWCEKHSELIEKEKKMNKKGE